MPTNAPVLTVVWRRGHPGSARVLTTARTAVRENRSTGITLDQLDVDADPHRAREMGVLECPTLVLHIGGTECGRLVGMRSSRAVLQWLLPELYGPDEATEQLRTQLASPGERFPRRALRRHERLHQKRRVELLSAVPLFEGLAKSDLLELGRAADEVVVEAGSSVTVEGEPGSQCFVVSRGELSVRRGDRRVARSGPGDLFGEMSLLDGLPRSATVVADSDCVLLALDRDVFQNLIAASPTLALQLLETLSLRVRAVSRVPVD